MTKRVSIVLLSAATTLTLMLYYANGAIGMKYELGELFKWSASRTVTGCSFCDRYVFVWYCDPRPPIGAIWGVNSGTSHLPGIKYTVHANAWGYRMVQLRVSLWVPAAAFAAWPAWTLARAYVQKRRPKPGFCANCNYNLTGNTSGRCPECGTPIAPTPSA